MSETEVLLKNRQQEQVDQNLLIEAATKSLQVEEFDKSAEISIVLVDDEHIQELNREYRGSDRPTDVLAFSQIEGPVSLVEATPVTLGDIVVSVETAQRQADERGHSLDEELALLVVHGVLHLLGYDDETEEGAADMRSREQAVMDQLENYGRPTI